jgi:glucosylceramidase
MKSALFNSILKKVCWVILFSLSFQLSIAQTSEVWLTTGSGSSKLAQQGSLTFGANSGSATTVTINEGSTYQTMDGFGFTLTEGSCEVINSLGSSQQTSLLNELFSTGGVGITMLRISIGASDLSSSNYSYRDGASFSLAGPDLTYLIPMIKRILAINPNIKILATPWSAPRWMKSNGGWVGGTLNTSNYGDYATYFVDYLNAMKGQGINIWGITPQNEPENPYNNPSMTLTAQQELTFINNNLGPAVRNAGYSSLKIIGFDHNCDNTSYPTTVASSSYVDGSAFHLYSGNISALTTVKNNTGKNVYFTEQWTSSAGSFSGDLSWHTQNVTIGASNNWAKAVFEWNLANNSGIGPYTSGGCTQCLGAITINNSTTYTRNVAYYIISHFSKFVKPNAVRIGASSNHGNLITTAFKNSDGSKVAVVLNNSGGALTFRIVWNNQSFTYSLAAGSVVTFKWNGTSNPPAGAPIGKTIALKGFNNQYVNGMNGTAPMWCNSAAVGTWEKFIVVDAGGGKIGLQSMSKFVSSENGATTGITCNRASVGGSGSWEQFDWVQVGTNQVQLRGNNGQYISSENGTAVMKCNRPTASGWETFTYEITTAAREATEGIDETLPITFEHGDLLLSPNPSAAGVEHTLSLTFNKEPGDINVQLKDINGGDIFGSNYKNVKHQLDIQLPALAKGMYVVKVKGQKNSSVKKYVIK